MITMILGTILLNINNYYTIQYVVGVLACSYIFDCDQFYDEMTIKMTEKKKL